MATPIPVADGDGDRYFSGKATNGALVYIGPVTAEQLHDAGVVGQSTGYYLCEFDASAPAASIDVLASFISPEAAWRFAEILGLYRIGQPLAAFEEPLEIMAS